MAHPEAQFYLFANCNFVPDRYADWQAAYDDLAAYVQPNEPTCMTYYFGVPVEYAHDMDRTPHMFAFEAYGKREDLYGTHFGSEAMAEFLKRIPETMTTGLDLAHYRPVAGFLDGEGKSRECGTMQDTRVKCKDGECREAVLERLRTLAGGVEGMQMNDAGAKGVEVLTYMVFASLDDEIGVRIFARWTGREAMEQFLRRKDVLDFWLDSKEEIVQMEAKNYVPNGKGWLHR
jgi:quinol monooxygenase YgiN